MLNSFLFGLLASSSLLLGGLLGLVFTVGKRTLGIIMGFGAGALISAVSYELILDAIKQSYGSGATAIGLFAGTLTFFFSDMLIERVGGSDRMAIDA